MNLRPALISTALVALTAGLPRPDALRTEAVDLDVVHRLKDEGFERSQLMEVESYLTDVYGPRLTGSPNIKEAAAWTQKRLQEWGLSNVHLERFPFGRGWQNQRFEARAIAPRAYPLIGFPKAWTAGTNGPVTAEAVLVNVASEEAFAEWRGKLQGKIVLAARPRPTPPSFEPLGNRFSDSDLNELFKQPVILGRRPLGAPVGPPVSPEFARARLRFFTEEGAIAILEPSAIGDGGTFFVQAPQGVSRDPKVPPQMPQVVVAVEHYGRIVRMLEKKIPVTLHLDIENTFHDDDLQGFSIVADLPGTDKTAETVIVGAHFDSWHAGTGATDNAAGVAVMMEALRILKATGVELRRTVRLGLWSGEEQGLLGSKAYVREHLADTATMQVKPGHARVAGYYNLDNGTGRIRGVYLQGNDAVAPIFESWMAPFRSLGMTTLANRSVANTDHMAFDAVGVPGFQFIQDPIEYDTRTHHSSQDVYERLLPDDLVRNAVIVASFVYHTANRDERLPRKPLPRPTSPSRGAPPPPPTASPF